MNMMNLNLGYRLDQSMKEEKKALHFAFGLVKDAKMLGKELRDWARQMSFTGEVVLRKIQSQEINNNEKLNEINNLESLVMMGLRSYMTQISDITNSLKSLNPPLKTDQIRPFSLVIIADRNLTVKAMEPLTRVVGAIENFKKVFLDETDTMKERMG